MPEKTLEKITADDLIKDLDGIMDRVYNAHKPVIIQGGNTEPMVLISLADFDSMVATCRLLKSTKDEAQMRARLLSAALGNIEDHPLFEKK